MSGLGRKGGLWVQVVEAEEEYEDEFDEFEEEEEEAAELEEVAAIEKRRATVGDGGAETFRGGVGAARSRSGARARGAHGRDDAHREAGHRVRTRVWGEHDPVQREWRERRATCAFG